MQIINKYLGLYWEITGKSCSTVLEHTTGFVLHISPDKTVEVNGREYSVQGIGEFVTAISHSAVRQGIRFSEDQLCLLARTLTELANDTQLTVNDSYRGIKH